MFDAGSTHTALYVYQWPADKENGTGIVSQVESCTVNGESRVLGRVCPSLHIAATGSCSTEGDLSPQPVLGRTEAAPKSPGEPVQRSSCGVRVPIMMRAVLPEVGRKLGPQLAWLMHPALSCSPLSCITSHLGC